MDRYKEDVTEFKIRANGDNEIDTDVLCEILKSTSQILRTASVSIAPEAYYKLKINAISPCCIDVCVKAVIEYIPNLLTIDTISYSAILISTFSNILNIKQFLKGKKPKSATQEGDKVQLINESGEVQHYPAEVFNIYLNNTEIDNSTINIFSSLQREKSLESFDVLQDKNVLTSIKKQSFNDMQEPLIQQIKDDLLKETYSNTIETVVLIKKPDFLGNSKWSVQFNGVIKDMVVSDLVFLKDFKNCKYPVYPGTALKVKLKHESVYLKYTNEFVSESFEIIEVKNVEQPQIVKQLSLHDI